MPSVFPLSESSPSELHLAEKPLADLDRLICSHIEEGRYPGAQIAIARHGKLALFRTYGHMRAGESDAELSAYIHRTVQGKEARHHIGEPHFLKPSRSMVHIGG